MIKTIIEDGIKVYLHHFCHCPCKERIPVRKRDAWIGIAKFKSGHQNRGRHRTLKSRKKMRLAYKLRQTNLGKPMAINQKNKISESMQKHYENGFQCKDKYSIYTYLQKCRKQSENQGLGFNPLNKPFKGCCMHHANTELVIFIPVSVHRQYWHRLHILERMKVINKIALNYLDNDEDRRRVSKILGC